MADATNYDLAKSYLDEAGMTARSDERNYALQLAQVYATLAVADAVAAILTTPLPEWNPLA